MTQAPGAVATRPLGFGRTLAFTASSLPISALVLAVAVQLPHYFASHLGVTLAAVGAAFGFVRAMDIWLDPVLGLAMDRSRTRFGRYRLWMIAGVPILMFALYMLYNTPKGASPSYLIPWLLVMYLGTSIMGLSHSAWAATLARTYQQRSRIFGALAAVGVVGSACALAIPIFMAKAHHTDADGVHAVGWFIIAALPVTVGLVIATTPERITRDVEGKHHRLSDYWRLFTRGNVLRILGADLCVTLGPGWMSALYLFFFKVSRGFSTTEANLLLMVYILAGLVGAPASAWLANRIGKHRALIASTTLYSLGLTILLALPRGNFPVFVGPMFLQGALAAGFGVMVRAITADVGDELRLEGGRERIGLLYALTTATTKIASASSIFLTFSVLAATGFDPAEGAHNTPAQIHGLELVYLIGPVIFVMLGGACFLGYKLGPDRHAEIRRQLEERDALYDETAGIEALTGEAAGVVLPDRA